MLTFFTLLPTLSPCLWPIRTIWCVWLYFLFWFTLYCSYHYLPFQCSFSPRYSSELYQFFFFFFSHKHISKPNFSIKSSSTTRAHGEPSFSCFYRSYVLGHLFYAWCSTVCHYLPFYVHVLSSSLDSMCPEHLVFYWGLKWPGQGLRIMNCA